MTCSCCNSKKIQMPTDVSVITTYRCQMRCKMCNIWQNPTKIEEEIKPQELEILPDNLRFANVTGGEPFLRNDLEDIVSVLFTKAPRIVISTSGYWVEKTIKLAEKFPNSGMRTLKTLHEMGVKDIGFGQTLSNWNSNDLIPLYELARSMNFEFATAAFHNSFYFHKEENQISNKEELCANIEKLCNRLLKENHPKSWFRAFFNLGLINYIQGNKRILPCEAGTVNFFIDPFGEVYPCNGLEPRYWQESMGSIRSGKTFEEIWYSEQAEKVRGLVRTCPKNCWMVGTAAPVMKKYITKVAPWVLKAKAASVFGKKISFCDFTRFDVGQDPRQGDLRIDKE